MCVKLKATGRGTYILQVIWKFHLVVGKLIDMAIQTPWLLKLKAPWPTRQQSITESFLSVLIF